MKNTVIVLITHRAAVDGTKSCIEKLQQEGAVLIHAKGHADLSCGRSCEITRAMDYLVGKGADPKESVVLFLDDDMHFTKEQAQTLVDYVRTTGRPGSGVYGGSNGRLCASNKSGIEWEVGMGFMACRLDHLIRIAEGLSRLRLELYPDERGIVPFSRSGEHPTAPGRWTSNDYWFCRELGGVDLLPLSIGHYKQIPIFPDDETVRKVIAKEDLGDKPPKHQPQAAGWAQSVAR